MTDKKVQVQTPYGAVEVDLTDCDGPNCSTGGQTKYMVGWLHLSPRGIEAPTFGKVPDPLDFCSVACAKAMIDLMAGI